MKKLRIYEVSGGHVEVLDHSLFDLGVKFTASHCGEHVCEPGTFLGGGDNEWRVAHAQAWVAPLL